MRMYDIIEKKTNRQTLTMEEIEFFIDGFISGRIPDYQASALIMAIYLNGMTEQETADLTSVMARSGDMIDLSGIEGIKVDKHSTGGIGDKTTVIIGPMIAACGGRMAKMSGRALGTAGGTIDKLESIPGFNVALTRDEFISNVNNIGMAVTGQTANVAPADKKIYAIRDVTATIASIPLIASSVMSKKLASGADKIVLDVKTGSGSFMKDPDEARKMAALMVGIGERNGRETVAFLTDMGRPLGHNIGNLLEMQEAAETLRGSGPDDLVEICSALAGEMLSLAGHGTVDECRAMARASLYDGSAYEVFSRFIAAQGGDISVIDEPEKYYPGIRSESVYADREGYVTIGSAEEIGRASMIIGAGRETKEDAIDYTAGIILSRNAGDHVLPGDELYRVQGLDPARFAAGLEILRENISIEEEQPPAQPLIIDIIRRKGARS